MEQLNPKIIYDERNLRKALKEYGFKIPLNFYKKTTSTNKLAEKDKRNKLLIVAKMQTDGRGRKDRKFVSQMGGIYFSYCFCPNMLPRDAYISVLLCGIAVIRALKKFDVMDAKLKWPNDIYIGKKKICGILSSVSTTFDNIEKIVLGVGLNVDNEVEKFVSKANNIKNLHDGKNFDKNKMLCEIIKCINDVFEWYYAQGFEPLRKEYLENCNFLGKKVQVVQEEIFEGIAIDVEKRGFLLVQTEDKVEQVIYGDVTVIE